MQTNRPCKLFVEPSVTFLGPVLSSLKVELDDCSLLYLAVKPDVLGKLGPVAILSLTSSDHLLSVEWLCVPQKGMIRSNKRMGHKGEINIFLS